MNMPFGKASFRFLVWKMLEYVLNRLWDNTQAIGINIIQHSHSISFARACLSINKVCSIEAGQDVMH